MATTAKPHKRAKPGSRSGGRFFHIEVRPAREFVTFRLQDIGSPGGVERLAGQRATGSWDTQKWLIEKSHAHIEDGKLIADSPEAAKLLSTLASRFSWRGLVVSYFDQSSA